MYEYENEAFAGRSHSGEPKREHFPKFKFEGEGAYDSNYSPQYSNVLAMESDTPHSQNFPRSAKKVKPAPPIRKHKPVVAPRPRIDYSASDLNGDIYLTADKDLSPSREDGHGTVSPQGLKQLPELQHAPLYNGSAKHNSSGPYSPHSYEVQGITGTRSRPTSRQDTLQNEKSFVKQSNLERSNLDNHNRDAEHNVPPPIPKAPEYKRGKVSQNIRSPPDKRVNISEEYVQDPGSAESHRNLSYRDRWERHRAELAHKSNTEKQRQLSPGAANRSGMSNRSVLSQVSHPHMFSDHEKSIRSPNQSAMSEDVNRSFMPNSNNSVVLSSSLLNKDTPVERNQSILSAFYSQEGSPSHGYNVDRNGSLVDRVRILSGEYRVNDPNRATLSPSDYARPDPRTSSSERDTTKTDSNTDSTNGFKQDMHDQSYNTLSLQRDQKGISTPNGTIRSIREGLLNVSRKSMLSLSKLSLSKNIGTVGLSDYGIVHTLANLALMGVVAIIVAFMALQLLFRINTRTTSLALPDPNSVILESSYPNVLEVTVALTTLVLMLDVCCLVVCVMQCFFTAKLLKCPQGEERAFKYLKECAGTRFIAVAGFFISIPTFLMAILLYILMEFRTTPAIISTVIVTVGVTFSLTTIIHSLYFWRVEKNKADFNIPPYESSSRSRNDTILSQKELSTLV